MDSFFIAICNGKIHKSQTQHFATMNFFLDSSECIISRVIFPVPDIINFKLSKI